MGRWPTTPDSSVASAPKPNSPRPCITRTSRRSTTGATMPSRSWCSSCSRAEVCAASWTEPTGALVGTARYAAPEQGTGATLDARADLYALGVVLVESVTGRVPEVADTLIGTLAARARTPIVAPEELGALAPVVERAGRAQPSERYPDAVTMADALADASRHLPPPGPLTLVGLDAHVDPHPTELGKTSTVFDQDADAAVATARARTDTVARADTAPAPRPGRYAPRAVPAVVALLVVAVLVAAGLLLARSA